MPQSRRPRRTKAAVEAAIIEAVRAELMEVGYTALTFEGVARRAEVSKPVLYRRHSSRVGLVLAAVQDSLESQYADPPKTGSLRTDLEAWRERAEIQTERIGSATLRGLVGEADEAQMEQIAGLMADRLHDMEHCVLEPARQRGEITGEVPASFSRLFFTLIRDRALFGQQDAVDPGALLDELILPALQARNPVPDRASTTKPAVATSSRDANDPTDCEIPTPQPSEPARSTALEGDAP